MKAVFLWIIFIYIIVGLNGCYTVPHHFADENAYIEIIVYYPDPIPPVGGPWPTPDDPYTPIIYPTVTSPVNRQPEKPKDDGNSYGKRDQLQDGSQRGNGEVKSDPPVRNPQQNDRVQ